MLSKTFSLISLHKYRPNRRYFNFPWISLASCLILKHIDCTRAITIWYIVKHLIQPLSCYKNYIQWITSQYFALHSNFCCIRISTDLWKQKWYPRQHNQSTKLYIFFPINQVYLSSIDSDNMWSKICTNWSRSPIAYKITAKEH